MRRNKNESQRADQLTVMLRGSQTEMSHTVLRKNSSRLMLKICKHVKLVLYSTKIFFFCQCNKLTKIWMPSAHTSLMENMEPDNNHNHVSERPRDFRAEILIHTWSLPVSKSDKYSKPKLGNFFPKRFFWKIRECYMNVYFCPSIRRF